MDQIRIEFPGDARVNACFEGFTLYTDQTPQHGGEAKAPTPFAIFLATLGLCAGATFLGFCRQRKLPTSGVRMYQTIETDPDSKMVKKISIELQLPKNFPEKYRDAVLRVVQKCPVKQALEKPPIFEVQLVEELTVEFPAGPVAIQDE